MKKLSLLALLLSLTVGLSAQSQRMVLLEHFTQASCGPCATYNPLVKQYFNNTTTNAVAIKYQTSWPGFDPMNLHNPTDVADRVTYYDVQGVPDVVIDGNVAQDNPGTLFAGGNCPTMDNRAAVPANFDITVFHDLSADLSTVNVNAFITATGVVANANLKAHVVIVEKAIVFSTAPGSNGELEFYNVMKKMLPSSAGTDLQDVWAVGNTVVLAESWTHANVYGLGDLAAIVFVQDNVTKEVMQVGFSEFITVPAGLTNVDVAVTNPTAAGSSSYCNSSYTPTAQVKNNSTTNLDSIRVTYTINGAGAVSQFVAANAGATVNATFPGITVAAGDEVAYSVSVLDAGYADLSTSNNAAAAPAFTLLDPSFDNGTEVTSDFQGLALGAGAPAEAIADNPEGIRAFAVNSSAAAAVTWPLGGNGNSDGCFRWDFYDISEGGKSMLVFEEVDFSNTYNNFVKFTYAYAQYTTENDRFIVKVSDDCGATWTEVFNKAGAALATKTPAQTPRFYPTATQWRDETIQIVGFEGKSDVLIAFEGISAYGNSLYLDDVNTLSTTVSTENVALETSLSVFPNPTVENFRISFELEAATDLSINLTNAIGQNVRAIETGSFAAGAHNIDVNAADLPAGTYFVTISNGTGVTTKTIVVQK